MQPGVSSLLRTVLLGLALAAALPTSSAAQRSSGRNLRLSFEPGSASQNGYADAQLELTYFFARCLNEVAFLASYNPVPRLVVGQARYRVDGRQVTVPPDIPAPTLSTAPTVRGTVRGNGIAKDISYIHSAASAVPSCMYNDLSIGPVSQFWQSGATAEAQLAVLNAFGLDVRGSLPALRNPAVEEWARRQVAAARADSIAKARAAEEARQAARRDSIQRAQRVAQARQDSLAQAQQTRTAAGSTSSGAAAAGAAAGTAGAAAASAAAGNPGGTTRAAEAPRASSTDAARASAEAEAAQAADMERRRAEAQARMAEEERRRKQEQDSAYVQAAAELGVATLEAVGPMLEAAFRAFSEVGFAFGLSFSSPYFAGDPPRIGLTMTGFTNGIMLPFFEFGFLAGAKSKAASEHSDGVSVTWGSVIPKTRFATPLGALQPHAGISLQSTSEQARSFLLVGLTRLSRTPIRLDFTIYGGSPRLGASIARNF